MYGTQTDDVNGVEKETDRQKQRQREVVDVVVFVLGEGPMYICPHEYRCV